MVRRAVAVDTRYQALGSEGWLAVAASRAMLSGADGRGSISVHPSLETSQTETGESRPPWESGMIDAVGYCVRRRINVPTKTAASLDRVSVASRYARPTLARNAGSVGGVQWISGWNEA